jgi:hypothetical protein
MRRNSISLRATLSTSPSWSLEAPFDSRTPSSAPSTVSCLTCGVSLTHSRRHTVGHVTVVVFARSTTVFFDSMSSSDVCVWSLSSFGLSFWLALLCRPWSRRSPWLGGRRFVCLVCSRRPPRFLATTTGSTTSTPAPATPSAPTSAGPVTQGDTAAALFCRYCKSKTREIEQCRRRPSHRKGGSTSVGALCSSSQQPPEWVLELTRRMDRLERRVAPPNPSMVSSITASPQLPQSGTQPPWILNSGASFHMTHESTHLDSLSSLHSLVYVKTVDGTPLPVVGQGTLYTSSFHVSFISHVPQLHLQLFLPARLLIMVVISVREL